MIFSFWINTWTCSKDIPVEHNPWRVSFFFLAQDHLSIKSFSNSLSDKSSNCLMPSDFHHLLASSVKLSRTIAFQHIPYLEFILCMNSSIVGPLSFPVKYSFSMKRVWEKFTYSKIWNCHSFVNIAQNLYYNLFLEMEQSFCIYPCGRNLDPGTWNFRSVLLLSRHPQNFCKKELILNQRYLPHPDFDSTDFFLKLGVFSQRFQIYN